MKYHIYLYPAINSALNIRRAFGLLLPFRDLWELYHNEVQPMPTPEIARCMPLAFPETVKGNPKQRRHGSGVNAGLATLPVNF